MIIHRNICIFIASHWATELDQLHLLRIEERIAMAIKLTQTGTFYRKFLRGRGEIKRNDLCNYTGQFHSIFTRQFHIILRRQFCLK